jgi:uncharacterized SAM-binding protein YcdF (DUF218 family)
MSLIGYFVFSGTAAIVLSIVAAVMLWRRGSRAARAVGLLLVGFAMLSIYGIDYLLARPLVAGYRPFTPAQVLPGSTVIVLLGAGSNPAVDWSGNHVSVTGSIEAARTLEAARVFRMAPDATIISSGGPAGNLYDSSAATMARLLERLGVPSTRIVLESRSTNTHDEAVLIKPMLDRMRARQVILVTSDLHMRRSLATFRAAGIDPVPAIARDPDEAYGWLWWILPTDNGIEYCAAMMHEYAGLVVYGLRGWATFAR